MDFIEKLFHITPDGGGSATELALFIVAVVATGVVIWRHNGTFTAVPTIAVALALIVGAAMAHRYGFVPCLCGSFTRTTAVTHD